MDIQLVEFPKISLLGGPKNEDDGILGSILGSARFFRETTI